MAHKFRLFWRTETGCDAGTPVVLEDFDAAIRARVGELADELRCGDGEITVRLPFLDRREWRRRSECLGALTFVREGRVIRHLPANAASALREKAAEAIAANPAWLAAPRDTHPGYFRTWIKVSMALQEYLRRTVPEIYFRDQARFEDRRRAWPLLVYQALRPSQGMPETEFTYDIAKPETLEEALRMIRRPLQDVLLQTNRRIAATGRDELARRYAPRWHEDILRAVQQRPKRLLAVLGDEAALVNAVITLGASRDLGMVKAFARQVTTTLRSYYDCDLRELAVPLLEEATRILEKNMALYTKHPRVRAARVLPAVRRVEAPSGPILRLPTLRSPRATTDRAFEAANTFGHYRPGSGVFP